MISLLYAVADAAKEFDTLYPINALRNVAVLQAQTPLIMVIDIDFVPSQHFWEYLTEESRHRELVRRATEELHVWALVSLFLTIICC